MLRVRPRRLAVPPPLLLLPLLALLAAGASLATAITPARLSDLAAEMEAAAAAAEGPMRMRMRTHLRRPTDKEPPIWPEQLHAVLLQNRDGALADVDLYYDYPGGRNLNIIKSRDDGSVLWDNERNNGSTYYYYPQKSECSVINFPVGILRPDWLKGARYQGVEEVNGHQCDVWAAASSMHRHPPFITYYCDVETQEPVRWVFFDGGYFDVQQWVPGGTLAEDEWQLPAYCFDEDQPDVDDEAEGQVATAMD